jgi:hypothetical protein
VSFRQAVICEQGTARRCRCRCKGTLHGAQRFGDVPERKHFALLPPSDPHHIRPRRDRRVQLPIDGMEDYGANLSRRRQRTSSVSDAPAAVDAVAVVGGEPVAGAVGDQPVTERTDADARSQP